MAANLETWKLIFPKKRSFFKMQLFIHSKTTFPGDGLLKPGDVFFREGPEEMTLEVLLRMVMNRKNKTSKHDVDMSLIPINPNIMFRSGPGIGP